MANQLPPGGLNKGLVVSLQCSCPPGCQCNSRDIRNWHHKVCGCPSFINEFGDIFAKTSKTSQNAKCSIAQRNDTWIGYRNAAQFMMALAQGIQAAEFQLKNDKNLVHFTATLNKEVQRRWNS